MIRFDSNPLDDFLYCSCGNDPLSSGFDACLPDGTVLEDGPVDTWTGHYICAVCGAVALPDFDARTVTMVPAPEKV